MTTPNAPAPTLELVLTIRADISPAVEVGPSDGGTRRYIPIVGGSFDGRGLTGEVLPGGADWQLDRPDGITEIDAHYSIRAEDGTVIIVRNRGIADRTRPGGQGPYLRSSPRFHAPAGPHDWLNRSVFVGTITPAADRSHVMVRVYESS
ncbi:MAG: DUF3237 family protein [Acidimicrobiales bacterium]|nr:DUF3237 family protein [Acidimicrobiales bacterium]